MFMQISPKFGKQEIKGLVVMLHFDHSSNNEKVF